MSGHGDLKKYNGLLHISIQDYFKINDIENKGNKSRCYHKMVYNKVIKHWPDPQVWYNSEEKVTKIEKIQTRSYWISWSMVTSSKLPVPFIKSIRTIYDAEVILKYCLKDYTNFNRAYVEIKKTYKYIAFLPLIILKSCIVLGVNEVKAISESDIEFLKERDLFSKNKDYYQFLLIVLYVMGYTDNTTGIKNIQIIQNAMDCNGILNIFNGELYHISMQEYFEIYEVENKANQSRKHFKSIYKKVLKKWPNIKDLFEIKDKNMKQSLKGTTSYWSSWSLATANKLPIEIVKSMDFDNAEIILKHCLKDYEKFNQAFTEIKKEYKKYSRFPHFILKVCMALGVNKMKDISEENIEFIEGNNLSPKIRNYYRILKMFLYVMGYRDTPPKIVRSQTSHINNSWSAKMGNAINNFLEDLKNSFISTPKSEASKIYYINIFAEWYLKYKNIKSINNLKEFSRKDWLEYIKLIRNEKNISNKTKRERLLAFVQLYEWLYTKRPELVGDTVIPKREDYKVLVHQKTHNWAFEKREHGEKLLKYFINEYEPKTIKDVFKKEAIIVCANSGMRCSEVNNIKYKGFFYSEDEGLHKSILEYEDKVHQVNRPCYITRDGYEAIERLEKLRENSGPLVAKYNKKLKKKYIHLFEYRGLSPISDSSLNEFIKKAKIDIKLVDAEGNPVKGGVHAFRHFFAMTVFRESGYNISVVRYLLGHRKYDMSIQYLEEEMNKVLSEIRNEKTDAKYAGKGLNTLINIILGNNNAKEYLSIKRALENSKTLNEVIEGGQITKVPLGYCLHPCKNVNKCIQCINNLVRDTDKDDLIKVTTELFEFLCFKVSLYSSREEALNNTSINKDIADLQILIQEMETLGVNVDEYLLFLKGH